MVYVIDSCDPENLAVSAQTFRKFLPGSAVVSNDSTGNSCHLMIGCGTGLSLSHIAMYSPVDSITIFIAPVAGCEHTVILYYCMVVIAF